MDFVFIRFIVMLRKPLRVKCFSAQVAFCTINVHWFPLCCVLLACLPLRYIFLLLIGTLHFLSIQNTFCIWGKCSTSIDSSIDCSISKYTICNVFIHCVSGKLSGCLIVFVYVLNLFVFLQETNIVMATHSS